ncbi:MAG: hypothetical protein GHCLOJNM_03421 [bacterium]|nr:hypothetical protein [bacterium]
MVLTGMVYHARPLVLRGLLPLALFQVTSHAATWFVSPQGDDSDGRSWSSAHWRISDAISSATSEDDIWISEGIYKEAIVLKPGLSLYGGFAGGEVSETIHSRDFESHETIISATDSPYFDRIAASTGFEGLQPAHEAAGLDLPCIVAATDTIIDGVTVSGGVSENGGGIRCLDATLTLRNCKITRNLAVGEFAQGGGIWCASSTIRIERTRIVFNLCSGVNPWGGSDSFGGALYARNSVISIVDSLIKGNVTVYGFEDYGAGIAADEKTKMDLINCLIAGNQRRDIGVANNGNGGGIFLFDSVLSATHCTLANNVAGEAESVAVGGIQGVASDISIQDSILWNHGHELTTGSARYSSIQGGYPGPGNIDADPVFVNPEVGDYRLLPNSPCIDSGTITSATTDLDGKPRPVDIVGVGTEGAGAFDMGAYEFQFEDFATRTPTGTPTITLTPTVTLTRTITRTKSFTRTPTVNETDFSPTPTLNETDFTATPTRTLEATLTPTPEGGQGRAEEVFHFQGLWHQAIGGKSKLKGDKEAIIDARDLLELIQRLANEDRRYTLRLK